jgi:Mg2+/Co2+ transporter CorB
MLLGVLDLEKATVADVMIPRHKIIALDLNQEWPLILQQLRASPYSRIPVYRESLDNILGVLHLRKLSLLLEDIRPNANMLESLLEPAYFIPESTALHRQLLNFQKNAEEIALVVDEYGDIQGLATAADILEEIVGEFLTDQPTAKRDIQENADGSHTVSASITIRDLNRILHLELPTSAKTLAGLITDHLETIPSPKVSLLIAGYPIEILHVEGNAITKVRIGTRLESHQQTEI